MIKQGAGAGGGHALKLEQRLEFLGLQLPHFQLHLGSEHDKRRMMTDDGQARRRMILEDEDEDDCDKRDVDELTNEFGGSDEDETRRRRSGLAQDPSG